MSCFLVQGAWALQDGLYAEIVTDRGTMVAELYYQEAPYTVMNFVGLAEGSFLHNRKENKKFYDGLTFHRVVKDFVIQGGDPEGTGRGGPGYQFPDEIHRNRRHNDTGILSMANAGRGTNGSQFFITFKETPWLDGKHTVFGKVVKGKKYIGKIEQGDKIETINILRIGAEASEFMVNQETFFAWMKERQQLAPYQFNR